MKKLFLLLISLLTMFLIVPSFAEDSASKASKAKNLTNNPANKQQTANHYNNGQIMVYSAPDGKQILAKLPANTSLIPIYRQKDWIKVGNPRNGQVGWVNKAQLRQARKAFFRPDIQTIYIHSDRNKNGKLQLNIVAYKNGEKLSAEQAKRLYEVMRENQLRDMRRMTRWMDEQFFEMAPIFQPVIMMPAEPTSVTPKTSESTSQPRPQ